jgi:hypothetical protein
VGPTRQGHLQPSVYAPRPSPLSVLLLRWLPSRGAAATLPPALHLLDGDGLEAEKAGRGELWARDRWDQAPPRFAARPGRAPEVGGAAGGVELPRGRWGTPPRSVSGRWGRAPLGRRARPVGRAPPRPAGASSLDGAGA